MPSSYSGNGAGLCVMFAGLSGNYRRLELSVDGADFTEVRQDPNDPFYSMQLQFSGLEAGTLYMVRGRVTTESGTEMTSCTMPALFAQPKVRLRSVPVYPSGGMSKPRQRPKVSDG